eukprot:CAMPEP_0168346436 /NCGR_PEP_ID=MMETSP0213-20121227/18264_1 /TAXON_ID=151035 /ORGANISM="Euplotes harpa, Strain FSP1.4" /LENGTH=67 /DNA_ID=CAMNT_0008355075 /DNA_START=12 /DNA_END=212 /DNA_ORIENTATION=-
MPPGMPGGNQMRQMRPQNNDPSRAPNFQQNNFGNMNPQMRPNDGQFFGNSGMKGGGPSTNDSDDIDW